MAKLSLFEKFKKVQDGDARVKKGLSRRVASAKKQIAADDRAIAKLRGLAVKETISRLNVILAEKTDITRIRANAHIQEQGVEQMNRVFNRNNEAALTILDIEKFAILIEGAVADCEADNLVDAANSQEEFNAAVNEYVFDTLEAEGELDDAKIEALWDTCVTKKDNAVLLRGTTAFASVNMHIQQVKALVRNGKCEDWKPEISERLCSLFVKYSIDIDSVDMLDIFAAI